MDDDRIARGVHGAQTGKLRQEGVTVPLLPGRNWPPPASLCEDSRSIPAQMMARMDNQDTKKWAAYLFIP